MRALTIVIEKNQTHMMHAAGGDAGELTHKALLAFFGKGAVYITTEHPIRTNETVRNLAAALAALKQSESVETLAKKFPDTAAHIEWLEGERLAKPEEYDHRFAAEARGHNAFIDTCIEQLKDKPNDQS